MFDVNLSITGLQEAQNVNARLIAMMQPDSAAGEITRYVTAGLHRLAVAYTHVDTGALRASHRMELTGLSGRVYIDENAVNPRSGQLTSVYGFYEHERGGEHAFYDRAVEGAGALIDQATELFRI